MEARARKVSSRSPEGTQKSPNNETKRLFSKSRGIPDVDVDEVLYMAGGFGRFQIMATITFMFLVLSFGFHFTFSVFIGADPPWRCIRRNSSSFCRVHYGRDISSDSDLFPMRCHIRRWEWEFVTHTSYSFVTEFDLVCERTSLAALATTAVYIGGMIGSIIAGSVSASFGRKPVVLGTLLLTFVTSLSCAYITQVWQMIVLRSFLGASTVACYFTAFVLVTEYVTPVYRASTSNAYVLSLTASFLVVDLWAYFERRWRRLAMQTSFGSLCAFVAIIFLPESPRYLLVNKKVSRARQTLETIARINGKPLCDINLKIPAEDASSRSHNYLDLIKEWRVLLVTMAIAFQWLSTCLAYYALSLEAGSMGGDLYKTFALVQCADLPSFLTSAVLSDKFGRKRTYLASKVTAGLLVGVLALVPQQFNARYTINITVAVVAKFFTENALNVLYAWSSEIFPTVLRGEGVSVCVIFQRLGMLIVPFLTTLLQRVNYFLPFVFICVLALLACGAALVLPETNKRGTRETYEDFFENGDTGDRSYERIE